MLCALAMPLLLCGRAAYNFWGFGHTLDKQYLFTFQNYNTTGSFSQNIRRRFSTFDRDSFMFLIIQEHHRPTAECYKPSPNHERTTSFFWKLAVQQSNLRQISKQSLCWFVLDTWSGITSWSCRAVSQCHEHHWLFVLRLTYCSAR